MFITAKLCSFAKLCTVSPVDESMHTWLATCNDYLSIGILQGSRAETSSLLKRRTCLFEYFRKQTSGHQNECITPAAHAHMG